MPVLRFLASIFALAAIVSLVADATPALNGTGSFAATSILQYWQELAPASLASARTAVTNSTFAWVWDPVVISVLDLPAPVPFGVLALICGFFGRRREELKLHIN